MSGKKFFLTVLLAAGASVLLAQDEKIDFAKWQENKAPGVFEIAKRADGVIESFLVVGKAPISTALSKPRARLQADKAARLSAHVALSQFLGTSVKWSDSSSSEMVIKTEGTSRGDEAGQSQTAAQVVETSSENSQSSSQAVISALQLIWSGEDLDGGTRVHIYRWQKTPEAAAAPAENVAPANPAPANPAPADGKVIEEKQIWITCVGVGKTRSVAVHAALVEAIQQIFGAQIKSDSATQERFRSFAANTTESASVDTEVCENVQTASNGFVRSYRIISVKTIEGSMQQAEVRALMIPPRDASFRTVMVCPMQMSLDQQSKVLQIGNRSMGGAELADKVPEYLERAFSTTRNFVILNYKDMARVVSANRAAARNIASGIVNPSEAVKFGQLLSADFLLISRLRDFDYQKKRVFDPKAYKISNTWTLRITADFKMVDTKYGNTVMNLPLTVELNEKNVPAAADNEDIDLLSLAMDRFTEALSQALMQIK